MVWGLVLSCQIQDDLSLYYNRYKRRKVAYNCQIFEALNVALHGHYTHVYSFPSYWHKCGKQNMSSTQGKQLLIDDEELI